MSLLALTKSYGDLELLFKADVDTMWDELEVFTNGMIGDDNVQTGWAAWEQVILDHDAGWYFGTTRSAFVKFDSDTMQFIFAHDTVARDTIIKLGGTEVARVDSSANFSSKQDIFFYNRNTTYPLSYFLGYQKPVIIYSDGTTINCEQNTAIANRSLIIFPAGPIHVTEDISSTHKFRQLKTSATANGYATAHTGAADSGMKSGVSLTANTWYFVYAVIVRGGDDAGNNFIMVVDSLNPTTTNWSALDTAYGTGGWVYLGAFRYGHGGASTTTMIPFLYDHQGWITFTGRAAADNFFGIRVDSSTVTSTTGATLFTASAANSGNCAPANMSAIKVTCRVVADGDSDMEGQLFVTDSGDNKFWDLLSFGNNLTGTEAHGVEFKIANGQSIKLKGKRGSTSTEDFASTTYISGCLDEAV